MKIIRNDVCYVQLKDIEQLKALPLYVFEKIRWSKKYTEDLRMTRITDPEVIEYFNNQDFIWDADYLASLSDNDLELTLKYLNDEYEEAVILYKKHGRIKNSNFARDIDNLKYKIKMLKYYIKYKYLIDQELSYLDFETREDDTTTTASENKYILIPVSSDFNTEIITLENNKTRVRK